MFINYKPSTIHGLSVSSNITSKPNNSCTEYLRLTCVLTAKLT